MSSPVLTVVNEITFDAFYGVLGGSKPKENYYCLQVGVFGAVDYETGVVLSFEKLNEFLKKIANVLDGKQLNDIDALMFPTDNPTKELLCVWIATQLMDFMEPGNNVYPGFVRLYENGDTYAEIKLMP